MTQKINTCFVYGSLKRNHGNHRVMEWAGGTLVGEASLKGATMYSLGAFPGVVLDDSENIVHGEVYEVRDFVPLDRLEGAPSFYDRRIVKTSIGPAWVYFLPPSGVRGLPIVDSGIWE